MRVEIASERISFVSDSFNVEPWSLKFHDDNVNYFWRPHDVEKLGAAVCFPLLGTLPGDRYRLEGREYTMETHGFAHTCDFSVAEKKPDTVVYELAESPRTLEQYPYRFRFRVAYSVKGATLRTEYRVLNRDRRDMYFSVGGHPRYACPPGGEGVFADWRVEFEAPESTGNIVKSYGPVPLIEKRWSGDGKSLALDYEMFEKGCFCLHPVNSRKVTLKSAGSGRSLTLHLGEATHLQFWTAVGGPYLCMEPWFGAISSLPPLEADADWCGRPGTLRAAPGEELCCGYDVTIAK